MRFLKIFFNFINLVLDKINLIIIPKHFYTPIVDLKTLKKSKLLDKVDFEKINYNTKSNIKYFLSLRKYIKYFEKNNNYDFAIKNKLGLGYGDIDSIILQSIIKKNQFKNILEIGSGTSTYCIIKVLENNSNFKMTIIDPLPNLKLKKFLKNKKNIHLIEKKLEEVDIKNILNIRPDFLFIDSSHTVKQLNDVDLIYTRLLPKIKNCIIHIHDIFFPYLYQCNLKTSPWYQWSETQLLYCYLLNNFKCKVILDTSQIFHNNKKILKRIFPKFKLAKFKKGFRIDSDFMNDSKNKKIHSYPASIYLKQ